jgi:hypothetical protein
MPRWLPVVAVVSLALLLGVAARVVFLLPTNPNITHENFQRIKAGMKREEVEAILGPPGDYRTGPTAQLSKAAWTSGPLPPLRWRSDELEISVWTHPSGAVLFLDFMPMSRRQTGMMDWLAWRLAR